MHQGEQHTELQSKHKMLEEQYCKLVIEHDNILKSHLDYCLQVENDFNTKINEMVNEFDCEKLEMNNQINTYKQSVDQLTNQLQQQSIQFSQMENVKLIFTIRLLTFC